MTSLSTGEFRRFEAAGRPFVYLVPSAAVFALDELSDTILQTLESRRMTTSDLGQALADRFDQQLVEETVGELLAARALVAVETPPPASRRMLPVVPLTTMVLNVSSQCNLSCTYCYEYGEDRIVDTANGKLPKFMNAETARRSVDFMLRESGDNQVAHLTFFGGETLLNFPVLRSTIAYARERAAEVGKRVEFSLTTNATLLRPDIIEFLAENDVSVTISIDGPRQTQDKFRVFHDGAGSYDVILPKIKALLERHRRRSIGARVTLTSANLDVKGIFRHLTEEIGFREVGFAPVTTSPNRTHAVNDEGFDIMLGQFRDLAYEFLERAVENRHHGFSNVKDTIEEIHKGASKAYPCGAGLGLVGVATNGEVALCHRFAGSDSHRFGSVADGIDRATQQAFLERHHIDHKTDCRTCWARPLCAGGCYHEAHTRYGTTDHPNLHYCEWIRGWTDTCLQIYGELSVRNPAFLARFDQDGPAEAGPTRSDT